MVYIVTKRINGEDYLYLVTSVRKNDKVIQKTIKYIGKKRPITKDEFECMKYSHSKGDWVLTGYHDQLSYQDHNRLKKASDTYKRFIKTLDKVSKQKEKEKFLSIFISNSNAIEGSTLSVKETFDYLFNDNVPKGHKKKELYMADNLLRAWNYVEKNCKHLPNHKELFELHKLVNKNIESDSTLEKYKKVQNYVGNVYTSSFLFTDERMKALFAWIRKAFTEIDDFEVAFQSHAQFEIIHPFVDGNGRVGRLVLCWLLMNKGLMPLAISAKKRGDYISALENSRRSKIEAICRFCMNEYLDLYKFM